MTQQTPAAKPPTEIILDDMDAWRDFAALNEDALRDAHGSIESALRHALDGGVMIGGGAAASFFVSFRD